MGTKKADEDKEIKAADAPEAEKIGGTIVQKIDTVVLTIAIRLPKATTETETVIGANQRTHGLASRIWKRLKRTNPRRPTNL